jgi:hypothetical protein
MDKGNWCDSLSDSVQPTDHTYVEVYDEGPVKVFHINRLGKSLKKKEFAKLVYHITTNVAVSRFKNVGISY